MPRIKFRKPALDGSGKILPSAFIEPIVNAVAILGIRAETQLACLVEGCVDTQAMFAG